MTGYRYIDHYIKMVRNDMPKPYCVWQHKLCDFIEKTFAEEDCYVDEDQLKKYLAFQKYFPYINFKINYDYKRKRYDLCVQFLNEVSGEIILDMKVFAPDEEKAKEMKERFLSRPSRVITRTMNMFLKDDYFMYDD